MKTKILSIIIAVTGLMSCQQDGPETEGKTTGTLQLVLETALPQTIITRSSVDLDALEVKIIRMGNEETDVFNKTYEELKEEGLLELEEGRYIVRVSTAGNMAVDSSDPYYFGESEAFTIGAGAVSVVEVICKSQYIQVDVDLSALLSVFDISGVEMWNGTTVDTKLYSFDELTPASGIYGAHYFTPDDDLQLVIKGETKDNGYPLGRFGVHKLIEIPELNGEVKGNISLTIKAQLATGDALQASVNDLIFNAQLITAE